MVQRRRYGNRSDARPRRRDRGRNPRRGRFRRGGKRDRRDEIREIDQRFERMTAVDPTERLILETEKDELTTRVVDLFAPIGKGQRALVVSPPKAGKTILLQKLAAALAANHPDVKVYTLLVDERPEEVTDFRRNVPSSEVIASCSDMEIKDHVSAVEETFFKARKDAIEGRDAVVLLDSITRMARAYNHYAGSSGRTMTGGLDSSAMIRPRRFFGSARDTEEAGSLTVIATALVETGSRMDDIIFEEFKGTGNTEILLSRKLAENRLFPAVDIGRTSTRREEKILHPDEYERVTLLRKALATLEPMDAISMLLEKLKETGSNAEFLLSIKDFK